MKRLILVATTLVMLTALALMSCGSKSASTPLVAATNDLNGKFSPFSAETAYDRTVSDLVLGDAIVRNDRAGELVYTGIEGVTRAYNGHDYRYTGIADVAVNRDDDADRTTYHMTLREGVRFSDGKELTADDLIFSLYVYCDPAYVGSTTIASLAISGLADYRSGNADYISGISKQGRYAVDVVIDGLNTAAIYRLALQPAPLHYYGDEALYDYDAHRFGFVRGNLAGIYAKDSAPMGAGPYRFIKFENKVVYFEANDYYWRGAPKTPAMQLKVTTDADKIPAITTGAVDIADPSISKEAALQIAGYNRNKQLSGDVITYQGNDTLGYGYIGLNAAVVRVGTDNASDASKNLRKGIATVLAVYRDLTVDSFYGDTATVINYPISSTSWAAPRKTDPDYRLAYSRDVTGADIYTAAMNADDRAIAARQAALGFFKAAGYVYNADDSTVVSVPSGAALNYDVLIAGGEDHPSFMLLTNARESLQKIGITLNLQPVDGSVLFSAMHAGTAQLWCAAWSATLDPDMYQVYHSANVVGKGLSSNLYAIADTLLDEYIDEGRSSLDNVYRREVYRSALDVVMDWGVEVPVYQRQDCILFSTKRVNTATLPKDMTTYWRWEHEVYNIEMR